MPKKILISFFVLILLLSIISFLPFCKWVKLDDFNTNQLENAEWSVEQYNVGGKALTMMSTPVSIPHSKKLKLAGTIFIQENQKNAQKDIPDLPLTIDLYGGPEFDSPDDDINITYQQVKAGATFNGSFEISGQQTNLYLRIFHYFPNSQIAGKFELYTIQTLSQNIAILSNKTKANFYWILIFLIVGSLIFLTASISSNFKKVYLGFGIISIIIGLTIQFFPINYFASENIIEKNWNKKTTGTNKLKLLETQMRAMPILIESNKYYLINWQDRLINNSSTDFISWRLDLFGSGGIPDWGVHETERYFSTMKNEFQENNFIINSRNFTSGYIRFRGPWGNGIEISNISISEIPEYIVNVKKLSIWFFIFGILLSLIYFKNKVFNIYNYLKIKFSNSPAAFIISIFLSYLILGGLVLCKIWMNRGGQLDSGVIYRFIGAPFLITIILYIAGWPFIRWCLKSKQKKAAEILLAFPIGFLIILSTHSLSYLGVTPIYRMIILCGIILFAWGWQLFNKQIPKLPNASTAIAIIFAIFLFWIGIYPLLTQKDTFGFTITNNDISCYIPFVQWDMEHSMKEAYDLSIKHKEPPYIGFMAWRMRQQHVAFGNYTAIAVLASLTGLSAYQIYPLMSGIFISLIFLSILGSLLAVKLIKIKNILPAILCLGLNFLLIHLVWESFYSSMVGFIALFPITAFGTYALLKRNYRFTLIAGLGLASLLNAYPQYLYMVCAQLALASLIILTKETFARNWKNISRVFAIGFSIFIFTLIFAPQQTTRFVKQNIQNPNAASSMSNNKDGGGNYPKRSYFLVNGFLGDWTNLSKKVFISPKIYRTGSFILSFAFIIILLRLFVFRAKTWTALFIFSSVIPYGLMVAWAYFKVPNPYIYFKSLGYVAPFVSAAFLICWLDWFKVERFKFIKKILLIIIGLWIIWRIVAVYAEVRHLQPRIFIGKSVTSLDEIYEIVPETAPIRINFTKWFKSAHIVTILRHRHLHLGRPFDYVSKSYFANDWKYSLENKPLKNKEDVWNNGTYYLY